MCVCVCVCVFKGYQKINFICTQFIYIYTILLYILYSMNNIKFIYARVCVCVCVYTHT